MALGRNQLQKKKIYLGINHGKIVQKTGNTTKIYDYLDGTIATIYSKESTFGNEVVTRWYLEMRDEDELYSICFPYSSGVFKSIILALASDPKLTASTPVRIEPYEGKNGYTKVVVYSDGIKLDWITKDIPPQDQIRVGGRILKDDTKQMALIESLVSDIIGRLIINK